MVYGSVYSSIHENSLSSVEPFEFDESMSFMEMGAQTIEESTEDWNNMMKAIALTELSYVAETGQELIYEAVDFGAIKDKVVGWFKKLWAKIQGIARAAMAKFKSLGKDDEGFLSKYTQYFNDGYNKIPNGFSFKGYRYNDNIIDKAPSVVDTEGRAEAGTANNSKSFGLTGLEDFSKFPKKIDDYCGRIVPGSSGSVPKSQLSKALNKAFRGSDAKVFLNKNDINVNTLISHVSGCKTAIDNTKEAETSLKDSIDAAIDAVETMANNFKDSASGDGVSAEQAGKDREASTYFTKYSDYLRAINQANATWFSTYISVLKERNRQSKALLVKLVSFANGVGGKKDSKNEAASILEDRFAAIFD